MISSYGAARYALTSFTVSADRSCALRTVRTLRSEKSEGLVSSASVPGWSCSGMRSRTSVSGSTARAAATTSRTARSRSRSSCPTARVSGASGSSVEFFLVAIGSSIPCRTDSLPRPGAARLVPENGRVNLRHVLVLPDRDAAEEVAQEVVDRFGLSEDPRLVRDALAA